MCINIALTGRNTEYRSQLDVDCDMFILSKYQFINVFAYLWLAEYSGCEYGARPGVRGRVKWRNCDVWVKRPLLFLGNEKRQINLIWAGL